MVATTLKRFAAVLLVLFLLPASASAHTNEQIAETNGFTATLPLFGTSLTVAVSLDDVGNLSSVSVTPTGTYTATRSGPHDVRLTSADGQSAVVLRAKGDKLGVRAKVPTLADLLGSGTWTGDVFGTGETTSVPYTIGDDGSGNPTITIGSVVVPSGVETEVKPTQTKTSDEGVKISARVVFRFDGVTKWLTITVAVKTGDEPSAQLKIELKAKDRQRLESNLADLVGSRTWSGHLCDGTPVSVAYEVTSDGRVVFTSATGAPATTKTTGHGFVVRFTDTKVKVAVKLQERDGVWRLSVKGSTGKCGKHEGPTPTVNS
ncbi:MAG: hypothetical protein KatS3mg065_1248 [Chloroflexota bacterium]|nr:MAG: hypothetical protein KatS3mg065_1248 [Chloroflexota bacterium]